MKISIDTLIVEVTRRCNLSCEHCLRGNAENVDLNLRYFEDLMEHVDSITTIAFTGGEPTLNLPAINQIMNICTKHNVEVNNFYIASNGTFLNSMDKTKEVLHTITDLCLFCTDNEISSFDVSNSEFHEHNIYGHDLPDLEEMPMYNKFFSTGTSCIKLKYNNPAKFSWDNIIDMGRGKGYGGRSYAYNADEFYLEDSHLYGDLYLTVFGALMMGCDWSYDNMHSDHPNYLGHSEYFGEIIQNLKEMEE